MMVSLELMVSLEMILYLHLPIVSLYYYRQTGNDLVVVLELIILLHQCLH